MEDTEVFRASEATEVSDFITDTTLAFTDKITNKCQGPMILLHVSISLLKEPQRILVLIKSITESSRNRIILFLIIVHHL